MKTRGGFILMDAVGALVIVVILATAMAVAVAQQSRAVRTVEQSRQAVAIAERVLADLQTGRKPQPVTGPTRVEVIPVTGVEAPEGRAWVRVHVTHHRGGAELTGLVPRQAAEDPR